MGACSWKRINYSRKHGFVVFPSVLAAALLSGSLVLEAPYIGDSLTFRGALLSACMLKSSGGSLTFRGALLSACMLKRVHSNLRRH